MGTMGMQAVVESDMEGRWPGQLGNLLMDLLGTRLFWGLPGHSDLA